MPSGNKEGICQLQFGPEFASFIFGNHGNKSAERSPQDMLAALNLKFVAHKLVSPAGRARAGKIDNRGSCLGAVAGWSGIRCPGHPKSLFGNSPGQGDRAYRKASVQPELAGRVPSRGASGEFPNRLLLRNHDSTAPFGSEEEPAAVDPARDGAQSALV